MFVSDSQQYSAARLRRDDTLERELVSLNRALTHRTDEPLREIATRILELKRQEEKENKEIERKIKHFETRCCGILGTKHSLLAAALAFAGGAIIDLLETSISAMEAIDNAEWVHSTGFNTTLVVLRFIFAILTFSFLLIALFVFCCGIQARDRIQQLGKIELSRQTMIDIKRLLQFLEEFAKLDESKTSAEIKTSMQALGRTIEVLPVDVCRQRIFDNREELLPAVLMNLRPDHPMRQNLELLLRYNKELKGPQPSETSSSQGAVIEASTDSIATNLFQEYRRGLHKRRPLEGGISMESIEGGGYKEAKKAWRELEKNLGMEIPEMKVGRERVYRISRRDREDQV
ncbi:MAG: hypothetical protein KDK48_06910 [Chlamydiia bacterium]|nr:hypothetical protein [Chlamydiia bacterium]